MELEFFFENETVHFLLSKMQLIFFFKSMLYFQGKWNPWEWCHIGSCMWPPSPETRHERGARTWSSRAGRTGLRAVRKSQASTSWGRHLGRVTYSVCASLIRRHKANTGVCPSACETQLGIPRNEHTVGISEGLKQGFIQAPQQRSEAKSSQQRCHANTCFIWHPQ